jgi:hypothetical protein
MVGKLVCFPDRMLDGRVVVIKLNRLEDEGF